MVRNQFFSLLFSSQASSPGRVKEDAVFVSPCFQDIFVFRSIHDLDHPPGISTYGTRPGWLVPTSQLDLMGGRYWTPRPRKRAPREEGTELALLPSKPSRTETLWSTIPTLSLQRSVCVSVTCCLPVRVCVCVMCCLFVCISVTSSAHLSVCLYTAKEDLAPVYM